MLGGHSLTSSRKIADPARWAWHLPAPRSPASRTGQVESSYSDNRARMLIIVGWYPACAASPHRGRLGGSQSGWTVIAVIPEGYRAGVKRVGRVLDDLTQVTVPQTLREVPNESEGGVGDLGFEDRVSLLLEYDKNGRRERRRRPPAQLSRRLNKGDTVSPFLSSQVDESASGRPHATNTTTPTRPVTLGDLLDQLPQQPHPAGG